MSKTIRKMLMGDIWRIGEHESWFSDMSKEGWHLKKIGALFVYFEQGQPKDTHYRIDTSSNKKMSVEDKEMFQEVGWEHITRFGEFNVFSSPAELQTSELHTDPVEQSYTLKGFSKRIRMNTITTIIFSMLGIAIFSSLWFFDRTPSLTIIEGDFTPMVAILTYIFTAYTMLQANFSIRKLRKTLQEGSSIDHNAPWKKKRRMTFVIYGFLFALYSAIISMLLVQITLDKPQTLPVESDALPIVRLAEIEQNSNLVRDEHYEEESLDWLNQYTYNWSLFAPLQYTSNEFWQDEKEVYSPSLRTQVYKLNFPSMKENLLADLTQESSYRADVIKLESDVFEVLFIRQEDEFKEVFAAKGKGVIYVSYFGHADMDTILKVVKEKLALIEK